MDGAFFRDDYISRIEDECLLSQLVGDRTPQLNRAEVEAKAIELVKRPESELLEEIGNAIPKQAQLTLADIVSDTIKLLPVEDQKLLPPPTPELPKSKLGAKGLAMLKRIGWRTFCDEESGIYKTWNSSLPEMLTGGAFITASIHFFQEWKIDAPVIAAGFAATAMKYTCKEFCETFKPEGLMIPQNEK